MKEQLVKVIEILNPLRTDHRSERWIEWTGSKSLADYVPNDCEYVASVSGGIVAASEWDLTFPQPDDTIVICPVLQGGGGGGKTILRLVAFIALAVVTYGASAYFTAAYGAAAGIAAGMAVSVVGGMLINSLLPVQPASLANNRSDLTESPSYGINGAVNTSDEGVGVPVCYGSYRMAGNIVNLYTENEGKTQTVYMLVNAGEGPIAGITDIEVNGQPLSNYQDVVIETRTGTNDQTSIPWFQNTVTLQDAGNILIVPGALPAVGMPTRITTAPVDRLRVDLVAPAGIFTVDDNGAMQPWQVPVAIAYAPCDAAGNVAIGAIWKYDFGTVSVNHYDAAYHYLGTATYDPNTGEQTGGTDETVQATLRPGDVVVADASPQAWATNTIYQQGYVVFNTDRAQFYVSLTTHTSVDNQAPGTGSSWQSVWRKIAAGTIVTIDSIIDPAGARVGYTTQTANYNTTDTGNCVVSGQSRFPLRATFYSPPLPSSYYKVQIIRETDPTTDVQTSDEIHWESLGEIILDDIGYKNTALLGIKIRLSDQLSSLPTITYINQGVMTRFYERVSGTWVNGSTGNPAWAALDMITNPRYGARVPWSMVDINAFADWAAFCDAQSPPLRFDGVFDQMMAFWDAMKYIGRAGHAQIIRNGTRFSVVIERVEDPVMMFSEANIVKGTFSVDWLSLEDRANSIEINYWDKDESYTRKTVKVVDPNLSDLAYERNASMDLVGVTSRDRALAEGWLQLNMNNWVTKTVSFEAGLDAIACIPGSVIMVKSIGMEAAVSGRVVSVSGTHMVVDTEIDFSGSTSWGGTIVAPIVSAWTNQTVYNVDFERHTIGVANAYSMADSTGIQIQRVTILTIGGHAFKVSGWVPDPANPASGIAIIASDEDISGVGLGMPTAGTATDFIANGSIHNASSSSTRSTEVTFNFGGIIPQPGMAYVIGPTLEERRLYRVATIEAGASEYTRTIKAIEYHDEIYTATGYLPLPPPPGGDPGNGVIGHVRNLEMLETEVGDSVNPRYQMELHWDLPTIGTYAGAVIYQQTPGTTDWTQMAEVTNGAQSYRFDAMLHDRLIMKVQAVDAQTVRPPFSTAPTIDYTVGSGGSSGVQPTSLAARAGFQTIYLGWTVDKPELLRSTDIYATFDGSGGTPVSDTAQATLLVKDAAGLSYSFPADAGTYRFWIKVKDFFGRESDFYPLPDGVTCAAVMLVSDLMDLLDDQIYASLLDQFLRERIEIIPNLVDLEDFIDGLGAILNMGLIGDGNGAAVQTVQQTMVNNETATAQQITQLQSRMGDSEAAVQQEIITRASEDSAEAAIRTALAVEVDNLDGQINGVDGVFSLVAGIRDDLSTTIEDLQATAAHVTTLATQLTGSADGNTIEAGSYIYNLQEAISTLNGPAGEIGSMANAVFQMKTNLIYGDPNNPDDPNLINLQAGITSVQQVVTSITDPATGSIHLLAQRIDQLYVDNNGLRTAIEQRMLVSDAQAAYWLKIDAGGRVAGFGLGWQQDTNTFDFIVRTDRFAIGDADGTKDYPFIVANVPGSSPPIRGVFIRNAFIQNAAIDTAQIAGNAVTASNAGETSVSINALGGTMILVTTSAQFWLDMPALATTVCSSNIGFGAGVVPIAGGGYGLETVVNPQNAQNPSWYKSLSGSLLFRANWAGNEIRNVTFTTSVGAAGGHNSARVSSNISAAAFKR